MVDMECFPTGFRAQTAAKQLGKLKISYRANYHIASDTFIFDISGNVCISIYEWMITPMEINGDKSQQYWVSTV